MSANIPPRSGHNSQPKELPSALEGHRTHEGATPHTSNGEERAAGEEEGSTHAHVRRLYDTSPVPI
ncbi:hypothetical protein GGG16DRAFT_112613 [Schizophyllum commune]